MAITASVVFKGIEIKDAYFIISDIRGGKVQGGWVGLVSAFATAELSKPKRELVREAIPYQPAIPETQATEEDMAIPGQSEVQAQDAEWRVTPADPIFSFQVQAPFDAAEMNPYVPLYAAAKKNPALIGAVDA